MLKPLYREYKAKHFLVAVFRSGGGNLTDATSDLLCHDRKCLAQRGRQGMMGMQIWTRHALLTMKNKIGSPGK